MSVEQEQTEKKTDYINQTIDTYNQIAEIYSGDVQDLQKKEECSKLMSLIPKDSRILDAGCGYGKELVLFADAGYDVTGVDLSEKLLREAKKKVPNVELAKMDIRKMKFPDESFNAVWCNTVLLHLKPEDAKSALCEFHRILKPGGIFFGSVKKGDQGMIQELTHGKPRWFYYYKRPEFEDSITETGFELLETIEFNERERHGPEKRDIDFIECFARKK